MGHGSDGIDDDCGDGDSDVDFVLQRKLHRPQPRTMIGRVVTQQKRRRRRRRRGDQRNQRRGATVVKTMVWNHNEKCHGIAWLVY